MQVETPILPERIGRYEVVRLAGQGAMGRVLLARDPVLERDVAVKLLRDDLGLPPEMREALFTRMRNEAKAAARVSHPSLVTLHDMGDDARLGVYLVFEYVSGSTLRERLDEGPVSAREVARLSRELGSALDDAHGAGVVHRDVKPDNVMLARTGAKLTDFGIARVPDSTLTRAGGLIGTPAYSAPEALSAAVFSAASDQFSLAATLYEALFGRRAFPGDDALAVAAQIANEPPAALAATMGLDPAVDRVFARAFAHEPSARFATCSELGEALAAALEGVPAPPATRTPAPDAANADVDGRGGSRWLRVGLGAATLGAIAGVVASSALHETTAAALASRSDSFVAASAQPLASTPVASGAASAPRAHPRASSSASAATRDAGREDAATARDDAGDAAAAQLEPVADAGAD